MLSREVDVNSWEVVYVISWKKDYLSVRIIHNYNYTVYGYIYFVQIKEQFEEGGYTACDSTDVPVTADDNDVAVTVQDISANSGVWSMKNMEVLYSVIYGT